MNFEIEIVEVKEKKPIELNEVYFIKDTNLGNYISDGLVSKNCSTSLELGIDIGDIDIVVQISSPKSVTRAIQRIGRSGHSYKDVARGILIGLTRNDLIEQMIIGKGILEKKLDKIHIPKNCLDVLAQQILGMALEKEEWKIEDLYKLITRTYPYKDLSFEDFMNIIRYLAGFYEELEYRKIYAKIKYDDKNKTIKAKRGQTRLIYIMNVGTIPEEVKVDVYIRGTRKYVGSIEEGYLEKLKPGDVFVLGGKTYRFIYSKGLKAYVEPAYKENPNVPAWFSELLPLSFDTALEIGKFLRELELMIKSNEREEEIIDYIVNNFPVTEKEARIVLEYAKEQIYYVGYLPTDKRILIEYTYDLNKNPIVIFHTIFGRRVNNILSRALASLVVEKYYVSIPLYLDDWAFGLIVPDFIYSENFKMLFYELSTRDVRNLVIKNIKNTELFKIRFRHVATRGLMVLRKYKGKKVSLSKQQIQSETLLKALLEFRGEDFPLIKETIREILEDDMDIENAKLVLKKVLNKEIEIIQYKILDPSPFSHLLITSASYDIVKVDDRQRVLKELWEKIQRRISSK